MAHNDEQAPALRFFDTAADTDRAGRPAHLSPVQCAPWCKDNDGHIGQVARHDQNCWGPDHYVDLQIEKVVATPIEDDLYRYDIYTPRIGPCAYQGFNQHPVVYLHIELPAAGTDGIDTSCKLTAAEARQLAANLIAVADEIDGAK